jgi:hypothetical protein
MTSRKPDDLLVLCRELVAQFARARDRAEIRAPCPERGPGRGDVVHRKRIS